MGALVEFGELPPEGCGRSGRPPSTHWVAVAEELRTRPTQWAKITAKRTNNHAASFATLVRLGRSAAFRPAGEYEAFARGCDVWARYIGGAS